MSRALERGIVITNGDAFERAEDADVVAFDKTGTLTRGEMEVVEVETFQGTSRDEVLERAASLERFADHPVADAIVASVGSDASVDSVEHYPGEGVRGTVEGSPTLVGSLGLEQAEGWPVPEEAEQVVEDARSETLVPALVGWDDQVRGVIVAGDEPRPDWEEVVSDLGSDREVVVITGDGEAAAERFRAHPAVEDVFAGVPPEGKTAVIERLRSRGTVAMVGDGANDAPALAAADLGIAIERGARLASDAADAVITTDDLSAVPDVFDLTTGARRRIRQNLGWAFCYNAIAIPLAVVGALNPLFAAVAMGASSLLVVANSARSQD